MKAIVTGASGTVGRVLAERLRGSGHDVVPWDRSVTPVTDDGAMRAFLREQGPAALYHLAIAATPTGLDNEGQLVNVDWSEKLARWCGEMGAKFLFTSTVMVFTNQARGPFAVSAQPDEREGYGGDKYLAEQAVRAANADATIVRLGWQIGDAPGSNNMIDFFDRNMREHGEIKASRKWLPATSFLPDTAGALIRLLNMPAGLYQIDSNRQSSFYDIACALNEEHGGAWNILRTDDFVYDQRMIDERMQMPALADRLPALRESGRG